MTFRKSSFALLAMAILIGAQFTFPSFARAKKNGNPVRFTVRIENVSSKDLLAASDGSRFPFALSPGFWAVHEKEVRFFNEGKPAPPNGLETQAEAGNPSGMVDFLMGHHSGMQHGVFNTPSGAETPGPIGPGGVYEFTLSATPGMKLSLITMFGQSNDWFYAPEADGIHLFEKGQPLSGDITAKLMLWDAGTEKDEEIGIGPNQGPRQKDPNAGEPENGRVHRVKDAKYAGKNTEFFRVAITPQQ